MNPDQAIVTLKSISTDFKEFIEGHPHVSEADTRVKLIDRIIKEVLGWPEVAISREDHSKGIQSGFTDFQLYTKRKSYIVVEAKRSGVYFELPLISRRKLKISGVLSSSTDVMKAIEQARQYCVDDIQIPYAIVTNGIAWIVFKVAYKDRKWREENAVIFSSVEDIISNFVKFWNLLSYESVLAGSLENEFSLISSVERQQHRVKSFLLNSDAPLHRNRLHAQLHPIIDAFFDDIADKDAIDILKSCYVHSRSVKHAILDMDNVINDKIPLFLRKEGTDHVLTGKSDSGNFASEVSKAVEAHLGDLYILLGGIGSGKTTFIKRYLRLTGYETLEKNAVWFYIGMLGPPQNKDEIEKVIYQKILGNLREKYKYIVTENRKTIKKIFKDEVSLFHETTLKAEQLKEDEYEKRLSPFLDDLSNNQTEYVTRLLKECIHRNRAVIIFIDNVDQLPPEYQQKVFFISQKITRDVGSITILAMREESYYTASSQKALTAYANKKFHIASPRFRKLIELRLKYASKVLIKSDEEARLILKSGISLDKKSIFDFFGIIQKSIFVGNKKIPHFIDSICQGNMRQALEMFNTFLVSGATDVNKILRIYQREGTYNVAFHEFLKSVMLGEKLYYRESDDNPVMNVFECSTYQNSSHFTSLRILNLLQSHKDVYNAEGRGFIEWSKVQYEFENAFDNLDDVLFSAQRLLKWKLIEVNTKSNDSFENVTHIKCTSAGNYYLCSLHKEFAYIDLVLQDTPLNDLAIAQELTEYMKQVDNLSGKEEDKRERILVRFNRIKLFLEYLLQEESHEMTSISEAPINIIFKTKFVPTIVGNINEQSSNIVGRFQDGTFKYTKISEDADDQPEELLPGLSDLYDVEEDDDEVIDEVDDVKIGGKAETDLTDELA